VELALDGNAVTGFVTAISDGVISAFIPLLEVLPEDQHQRIGTELVCRSLSSKPWIAEWAYAAERISSVDRRGDVREHSRMPAS